MEAGALVSRVRAKRRPAGARWRGLPVAFAWLAALAASAALGTVDPGGRWSLVWGIAAATLLLAALLHGWRRRAMKVASKLGLGRSRTWLELHVHGGLLFLLLMLLHSGFRLPTGVVTWWLWGLSLWITASGLVGLALQKWIPRVLASGLSTEAHYDRIPELCEEIRERAERLAESSGDQLRALYRSSVAPALERPTRRWIFFLDITGGGAARLKEFAYVQRFLAGEERDRARELERLYRTKNELDAHYTLQHALRVWTVLHTPAALLLIAFVALHVFSVIYY